MTNERKREIEGKLNQMLEELKDIVKETTYGISIMVLPVAGTDNTSQCMYIHECNERGGLIAVAGTFDGALDKEFEYNDEEESNE